MSRATIRSAVKTYFDGAGAMTAAGLLKVHTAKPHNWKPEEWRSNALKSTAVGYVYISGESERRASTGKKYVEYTVSVIFLFRSRDTDSQGMIDDFDSLVDAMKAHVRADSRLGQPDTVVWQSGQNMLESGTDDTQYQAGESEMWGRVTFEVSEWITA